MDDRREQRIREIVRDELAQLRSGGGGGGSQESGDQQPAAIGRRGVLASLATAAGLGAGGYYAVRPALASTHSGELGTPSKLQRVWAETIRDSGDAVVIDVESGTYYSGGNQALMSVPDSGSVTLSSGAAVIDTGLSATGATFYPAIGVDDPDADTKVAARLFWDDSAGTYQVEFVETETSVGNPTVNYDLLRVR